MNKNLHNIEDLFRDSLGDLKDDPSPGSWENIEARLDKEDAANYKRKFTGLKRIAIIVLFMLLSVVIYEARFIYQTNAIANDDLPQHQAKEIKQPEKASPSIRSNAENKDNDGPASSVNTADNSLDNVFRETTPPPATGSLSNKTEIHKPATGIMEQQAPGARQVLSPERISTVQPEVSLAYEKGNTETRNNAGTETGLRDYNTGATAAHNPVDRRHYAISNITLPKAISFGSAAPLTADLKLPVLPDFIKELSLKKNGIHLFSPYWTLTAVISSDRSQYVLDNDLDDYNNGHRDEKTSIADRERHEPSFSTGVLGTYRFKRKWALQTGLLLSQTQIAIQPQKIYAKPDEGGNISYKYNSSSGYAFISPGFGSAPAIGDSLNTTEAKHNLSYLSVPLVLQYKWSKKRITISPGLGFSVNRLLMAKLETEVKDASNRETVSINRLKGLRSMYAGFIANADIQYNLGRNWAVNLTPSFKCALTSINKNNVVKTYPYSVGLGAGVSYRF